MRVLLFFVFSLIFCFPAQVRATNCESFMLCCHGYHTALAEAGFPAQHLEALANMCEVPNMPGAGQFNVDQWCLMSWYATGDTAWRHFLAGQAAFYPDSCPDRGDDEVLDPDPMEPDPEAPAP